MAWWNYSRGDKIPTPGAMEYALLDNWQALKPMIGPGIGFIEQRRAFMPQNLQGHATAVLTGVGGLASGQMMLQPLSDPYSAPQSNGSMWGADL